MPKPYDIRVPTRDIQRHLAVGQLKQIRCENPVNPQELPPERLAELTKKLEQSGQWLDEASTQALADHAAWFIMRHWPNSEYSRDDGRDHIPNLSAIHHLYRHWPPVANDRPQGEPRHPDLSYRKPQYETEPVSEAENARLWQIRHAAAARFQAEYADTGQAPPRLRLTPDQADNETVLAEIEGWHDFAASHAELRGALYTDYLTGTDRAAERVKRHGLGPAVPPKVSVDDVAAVRHRHCAKEAAAMVRKARVHADLKDLAIQRIVTDLTDPPPQRIKLSRERISDKFPHRVDRTDIGPLSEPDRDLEQALNRLLLWLRDLGFSSHADDANGAANLCRRLHAAAAPLLQNHSRYFEKPLREFRAAEPPLTAKAEKALDRLAGYAAAHSDDTPLGQAWRHTAGQIARAKADLAATKFPTAPSRYETDEYEALAQLDHDALKRVAVRAATEYLPHQGIKKVTLFLPGEWVAAWEAKSWETTPPDIRQLADAGLPYDWDQCMEILARPESRQSPAELAKLAPANPKGEGLPAMKPAEARQYADRFFAAAFAELDQRLHTMPDAMHQPALAVFRQLSGDSAHLETYAASRYRAVIGHAVRAYVASRYPGDWDAAATELTQAMEVPARPGQADHHIVNCLRQWRDAAQAELDAQLAQPEPAVAPTVIWRHAMPKADPHRRKPRPVSRPARPAQPAVATIPMTF